MNVLLSMITVLHHLLLVNCGPNRVHRAGPRKNIYYEPGEVKAAIVTCGGLCPGLNDVIRQVRQFFVH